MNFKQIGIDFIGSYLYAFLITIAIISVIMGPSMTAINSTCQNLMGYELISCIYGVNPSGLTNVIYSMSIFGAISLVLGYYLTQKDKLDWGLIILFGGMHLIPFVNKFSWLISLGYLFYIYQ